MCFQLFLRFLEEDKIVKNIFSIRSLRTVCGRDFESSAFRNREDPMAANMKVSSRFRQGHFKVRTRDKNECVKNKLFGIFWHCKFLLAPYYEIGWFNIHGSYCYSEFSGVVEEAKIVGSP